MGSQWRTARRSQLLAIGAFVALSIVLYMSWLHQPAMPAEATHPIEELIQNAEFEFSQAVAKQATTLPAAAAEYRARRARHPPPGFDGWFEFARRNDALVVESFFDQIHHDLEPFWGLPAAEIRQSAKTVEPWLLGIRNGKAVMQTKEKHIWMEPWLDLLGSIADHLPANISLDIPVNVMDESRLLVPWERVNELMETAARERQMASLGEVVESFSATSANADTEAAPPPSPDWIHDYSRIWPLVRSTCHPASPARQDPEEPTDLRLPAPDFMPTQAPKGSHAGYVANWTTASDACQHPHLRGLHGTFIEPQSMKTSTRLLPLFGGSKLHSNNEILLPPAMYWSSDVRYSGGEGAHGAAWPFKLNALIWRGAGTGGRNKAATWRHFQRHRFVGMLNGSAVSAAEGTGANGRGETFRLPSADLYSVPGSAQGGHLGAWLAPFTDVAFTDLLCFPSTGGPACPYTEPYYALADPLPMAAQFGHKYLADIDGNSFSGRFRSFMRSSSVPLKASVYREWHDARLWAWVHFVPLDNSFVDVYAVLAYLRARDERARRIAEAGQRWAEKVLRKEDMQVYVYRLLLEFARVCDDEKNVLGFVADLKE
ncbi:glycosyltransferase family 90 protein [Aplosporella prunicola CBS 121167]|uniref:Glycosyltransferase family 90 protein n=1 Tax=Aplosporella prunicola CBS 121167 TaxID=1176127 RepID=A0A6A6BS33_9PEZI|nr:glycosyltransferase family 90 protein [Aplosporella prunicola CBS 121167]KAF2146909.1 glycosyltransferase family 90 protein [Aplosporella prunicola CBS 121167]